METEKILQHPTEWLDDQIINHAQELIKRKYRDTDGLQDPVLRRFAIVDGKFVQVLQMINNHWICIAGNKNNEVSQSMTRFIYLFIHLFSIYLSLTNFISPYNQTSLPQTARLVSNIRCDQQHCGMLLLLTLDI